MKCDVCKQEKYKGNSYYFFTGFIGETKVEHTGYKLYTYKTPQYLHDKFEGWVCHGCYLQNLLLSEKTLIVAGITAVFSLFGGKFVNNLLIGLFFSGLAIGLLWLTNLPFFWTQHGDRALIKGYALRRKLEMELQGKVDSNPNYKKYRFYSRADGASLGWVKDNEMKI